jgi:hypothetical protein
MWLEFLRIAKTILKNSSHIKKRSPQNWRYLLLLSLVVVVVDEQECQSSNKSYLMIRMAVASFIMLLKLKRFLKSSKFQRFAK